MNQIIFSDTQISDKFPHITLNTGINVFSEIREYMIANHILSANHIGDLFDYKDRIPMTVIEALYEELDKWEQNNLFLTIVEGNHDRNITTTLTLLKKYKNIERITEVTKKELDKFRIICVPHSKVYSEMAVYCPPKDKKNILFIHYGLKDAQIGKNDIQLSDGLHSDICEHFDLVFAGHYHRHQRVHKNAWQIGSSYQVDFGEEGEKKGFIVFNPEELDVEFIELKNSPKFITINEEIFDKKEDGFENKIVKYKYIGKENQKAIENSLLADRALKVIFEKIPIEGKREIRISKEDLQKDDLTILKKYIERMVTTLNRDTLTEYAKEML